MNSVILSFYKLMSFLVSLLTVFNIPGVLHECAEPSDGTVSVISESGWASRLFPMSDGEYLAGYVKGMKIYTAVSSDGGKTFEHHIVAAEIDGLNCDNVNFFELDGKIYLAYRAIGFLDDGSFYGSIHVSVSEDFGQSWKYHSFVTGNHEPDGAFKGVWEPCLGEMNGELVCFYANDSTSVTTMQNIESLTYRNGKWTERKIISNGEEHNSRDGMPVWCRLNNGSYALVIESTKYRDDGYPFVIQLLYSKDGEKWSQPRDVYIPSTEGSKAAAPGICQTEDGRIYITFQTDEDKTEKGDGKSVAKIISTDSKFISTLLPFNFSEAEKIFPDEYDDYSTWGGIYTDGSTLFYSAGTAKGAVCNIIPVRQNKYC